jgi:hypothetical protein
MRYGLCLLVGGIALSATPALALDLPSQPEPAIDFWVPAAHPYQLLGNGPALEGALLYSNTTETGSRFNPGTGGNPLGSGIQQDITFDDIPIPNARLGGASAVDVTKVTVGIRRGGTAPATDINMFFATATTTVVAPDTELDVPFTPFGTASLLGRNEAAFITELVTFGDGVNTLFTVPLNSTVIDGFGTFLLGLQFTNGDTLNGWRLTSGADANANVMWIYDNDLANVEGAFNFGAPPAPAATFYVIIEGTPVPEPGSLGLLGAAGLLVLRRRR